MIPRRRFLASSVAALGLAPMAILRGQSGSPNDEIAVGLVGCGGQGMGVMAMAGDLPLGSWLLWLCLAAWMLLVLSLAQLSFNKRVS